MAEKAEEVIEWLKLFPGQRVGIDDGGLALKIVGKDGNAYFEIGGLPEEGDLEE